MATERFLADLRQAWDAANFVLKLAPPEGPKAAEAKTLLKKIEDIGEKFDLGFFSEDSGKSPYARPRTHLHRMLEATNLKAMAQKLEDGFYDE